jgi:ribosomal protein S18 acetylase RimI-like enzyme
MKVVRLTKATKQVLSDMNALLKQLRRPENFRAGTLKELQLIVSNKNVAMFVAKDGARVVGSVTLYVQQKVGKREAHVEDVVVDSAYRGRGLGKQLMRALVVFARANRVDRLLLTSNSTRKAANKLYQKVGFGIRKTNAYKMDLK